MAWALGYLPLLNVPVLLPEYASSRSGVDLTDADVLGLRFNPSGSISRLLVDCRTAKDRAVDRVLWVKGLSAFMGLNDLFLFKANLPGNARWLAKELGVKCLDRTEIGEIEHRLGLARLKGPYFNEDGYRRLLALESSFAKRSDYRVVAHFLGGGVWTLRPPNRVQTLLCLGQQNDLNKKLHCENPSHVALVLKGALMLGISLALLISELNVADILMLETRLREALHGGAEALEQKQRYLEVVARLAAESGIGSADASIDLASFPLLLEQVNRLLQRRYSLNDALRVIDLARHYSASHSTALPGHLGGTSTSLPAKLASDLLALFVQANGLDNEFSRLIINLLTSSAQQPSGEVTSATDLQGADPIDP